MRILGDNILNKDKEKLNEFIGELRNSDSTKEKKAAIKKINAMAMNAEAALDELMKIVKGRYDFSLQSLAEETVIKIGEPAIPLLAKFLKSPLRKRRSKGIGMLGEIAYNDKELIDKIVHLLRPVALYDLKYETRLDAIVAIKKLIKRKKNSESIIRLLGEVLRKDGMPQNRLEAGEALALADKKLAIEELLKSMDRKNYFALRFSGDTRVSAANALYSLSGGNYSVLKETIPYLFEHLKNDPYPVMRITVVQPLILAGGWDVVEEVLDIIIKDRFYQVRSVAFSTIGVLLHMKPKKKVMRAVIPLLKKIAREDKYEYVQSEARDLVEEIEEILKEENIE